MQEEEYGFTPGMTACSIRSKQFVGTDRGIREVSNLQHKDAFVVIAKRIGRQVTRKNACGCFILREAA
jgi:hypothetical protein